MVRSKTPIYTRNIPGNNPRSAYTHNLSIITPVLDKRDAPCLRPRISFRCTVMAVFFHYDS